MTTARSILYTPATRPDRVVKARSSGADAVIADLEDAVPWPDKASARTALRGVLAESSGGAPLWVRVNGEELEADLEAVVAPGLAGLMLPKAEPALLDRLDTLLAGRQIPVIALIETAAGILHAEEVARHSRTVRLAVGEADLGAELRLSEANAAFTALRLQIVLASAAAGLPAPLGPVERRLDAPDHLERTTRELFDQGFRGRTLLHPRQIAIVNEIFTPSAGEVARARALISAFDAAVSGSFVAVNGEFVDRAVVRQAHEVLARAHLTSADSPGDL